MDKLRALKYFEKVAEVGSFTEASRFFAVPASSVSRRISDLEEELGIALFLRSTRVVQLTELGKLYYSEIQEALNKLEQADELVGEQSRNPSGVLRITSTPSFGELKLAPSLHKLRSKYPEIVVDMNMTDDILDLSSHALDIAIRSTAKLPENLVARKLFDHRFQLVASPQFLNHWGMPQSVDDIINFPTIIYRGPDALMGWRALQAGRWREIEVKPVFISNHGQSLLDAVLNGEGLVLFPQWAIQDYLAKGMLQAIEFENVVLSLTRETDASVYLLYHQPKFRVQKVRVAIDFLLKDLKL